MDRAKPGTPTLERLMAKCIVASNGCWLWQGYTNPEGYGSINIKKTPQLVHKVSYQLLVAPVPEGMQVDHLCHGWDSDCPGGPLCIHRACFNPAHLQPKSPRGNTLAEGSKSIAAANAKKSHCPKGHKYTKGNTRVTKKGQRQCLKCQVIRDKGRRR
jgi:hypothetical protein